MDPTRFDGVVRSLSQSSTRRRSLGVIVGGALVLLGEAAPGLAKHRHRHDARKHRPQASAKPNCLKDSRCGNTCCTVPEHGTSGCKKGKCVVSCNDGFTQCGESCVETSTLCGGICDNVCNSGQTCCGLSCVDLQTDKAHCGSCATSCGTGTSCTSGACAPDACGSCTPYTSQTDTCYWLDCHTGTCCWTPISQFTTQDECEAQDHCSTPGGACYKWATTSCTAA